MRNQNEEMVEQALIEPSFPSVVENSKVAMQKDSPYVADKSVVVKRNAPLGFRKWTGANNKPSPGYIAPSKPKNVENQADHKTVHPVVEARKSTTDNFKVIEEYLEDKYQFRLNIITDKIEFKERVGNARWEYLINRDLNSLCFELQRQGIIVKREEVRSILNSAFVIPCNPLNNYLQSIPDWEPDMPDYIVELANRVNTTNQLVFNKYFRKWMIGLVASSWPTGQVNHLVLLLKGKQGIGKTRWLRSLIPAELKQYCYEGAFNPAAKEDGRLLAERMLIILDEFDITSDRQMDAFKSVVSSEFVTVKKAYSGYTEDKPRLASFAGTTNRSSFLNDDTGTRRFFVVEATEINTAPYEHLNMVYAQALYLLQNGESFYLTAEDIEELNGLNAEHATVNVELEFLQKLVAPAGAYPEVESVALTASEITADICSNSPLKFSNTMVQKIGVLLKHHGYVQRKSNGRNVYDVVLLKSDE